MTEYVGIFGLALGFLALIFAGARSERRAGYFESSAYVMRGEDLCRSMRSSMPMHEWKRQLEATVARRARLAERAKTMAWVGVALIGAALMVGAWLVMTGRV